MRPPANRFSFFFFNDTATTEIYTLSLHDALPISRGGGELARMQDLLEQQEAALEDARAALSTQSFQLAELQERSEEHTSELQSPCNLVCRLLLEKKKNE